MSERPWWPNGADLPEEDEELSPEELASLERVMAEEERGEPALSVEEAKAYIAELRGLMERDSQESGPGNPDLET